MLSNIGHLGLLYVQISAFLFRNFIYESIVVVVGKDGYDRLVS